MDFPVEIYAELSKSQLKKLENGEVEISYPNGVTLEYKGGSRICYFTCDDETAFEELVDGLDSSGISWQEI